MAWRASPVDAAVAPHLALILFLPWYAVLAWLFWRVRSRNASGVRKLLVLAFIALSLVAAGLAGIWAHAYADPSFGAIWKQVLASSVSYGVFLAVLLVGLLMLRTTSATGSRHGRGVEPERRSSQKSPVAAR